MAKDNKGGTAIYAEPLDVVYAAAVRVAASEGVITFADKPSGVISANIGGSKQQGRQARLSITVTSKGEKESEVQVATQGFQFGLTGWGDGKATKRYFEDLSKDLSGATRADAKTTPK